MSARARLETFRDWATEWQGSTRGIGLMRIGFGLLSWVEFGETVQPFRTPSLLLSALFYPATMAMVLGLHARLACIVSSLTMIALIWMQPTLMLHHTHLLTVAMALLALTPCGRSFSVDRWRALQTARKEGATPPAEMGNLWALRLVWINVSALFFWGGYNKITLDTLSIQPTFFTGDRLDQILTFYYSTWVDPPVWFRAALAVMGSSVIVFEVAAGILLWVPKYRMKTLAACVVMTSGFQIFLAIRAFGLLSYVLYLGFVPPEIVHRVIDELLSGPAPLRSGPTHDRR